MARGEYGTSVATRAIAQQHSAVGAISEGRQRTLGLSTIGSVAGAVLWKDHRIWGFILGGMAGGGLGQLIFAAPAISLSDWTDWSPKERRTSDFP